MTTINYLLLGEGNTDAVLLSIIDWLITEHTQADFTGNFLAIRGTTSYRIQAGRKAYPDSDVIFIHRDADKAGYGARYAEIEHEIGKMEGYIPVIPVRETEAWLLFDEQALRAAAGNPYGRTHLDLPDIAQLERLTDPKQTLNRLLNEATGKSHKRQRESDMMLYMPNHITDYRPLRALAAFKELETHIQDWVATLPR
jgi:hypothetical protein